MQSGIEAIELLIGIADEEKKNCENWSIPVEPLFSIDFILFHLSSVVTSLHRERCRVHWHSVIYDGGGGYLCVYWRKRRIQLHPLETNERARECGEEEEEKKIVKNDKSKINSFVANRMTKTRTFSCRFSIASIIFFPFTLLSFFPCTQSSNRKQALLAYNFFLCSSLLSFTALNVNVSILFPFFFCCFRLHFAGTNRQRRRARKKN